MKASLLATLLVSGAMIEAKPVHELEAREMTAAQNWCVAGGAILGGIGTFAAGIAAIIAASNKGKDCSTKDVTVNNKRDDGTFVDVMHEALSLEGIDMTGSTSTWDDLTGALTFSHGIHHAEGALFHNLILAPDGSIHSLLTSPDEEEASSSLVKRITWKKNQIYVSYHPTGKCATTKGKDWIKKDVTKALNRHSDNRHQASCYALYAGGKWTGHLKIMDVGVGGQPSNRGLERACFESHTVARVCE